MESSDTFDVLGAIRRRLVAECIAAWHKENDERCAKIMREFVMPTTRFHPCGDRVLIKPDVESGEKRTASGLLIIPDMGHERKTTGKIVALGPDCDGLDEGEQVLYGKYAGADIKLNDEDVVIVKQEDILGVIYEEPDESAVDKGSGEPDPPA